MMENTSLEELNIILKKFFLIVNEVDNDIGEDNLLKNFFRLNFGIKKAQTFMDKSMAYVEADFSERIDETKEAIRKITDRISVIEAREQDLASLKNDLREKQNLYKNKEYELDTINNNIEVAHQELKKLYVRLGAKYDAYDRLIAKLQGIKEQTHTIDQAHKKNIEIWRAHFESDNKIFGELANDDAKLENSINTLKKNIEDNLELYDRILKKMIELNETKALEEVVIVKK